MHKSVGFRLGIISILFPKKFFDIIIIRGLKRKYRHFRHFLAGSYFPDLTKMISACHNAQFISSQMYEIHNALK